MFKKVVHFISSRYIKTRRITVFAIAGVAVGVMTLIVVLSVMNGFIKEFKSRLQGSLSDIIITVRAHEMNYYQIEDTIKKLDNVEACAPHLDGLILIGTGKFYAGGIVLGVDYEKEAKVGKLKDYLVTPYKSRKLATERIFEQNLKSVLRKEITWKPVAVEVVAQDGVFPAGTRVICEKIEKNVNRYNKNDHRRSVLTFIPFTLDKNDKIIFVEDEVALEDFSDLPKLSDETKDRWENYFGAMSKAFNNRELLDYMSFFDKNVAIESGNLDPKNPFYVEEEGVRPVIMGYELMRSLRIKHGDEIALMTGRRDQEKNELKPITRKFMVVGAFRSGWQEIDARVCYTRRSDLRGFIDWPNDVKEVCVSLKNPGTALRSKQEIQSLLDNSGLRADFIVERWEDRRRTFLSAIQLERTVMAIILFFIVILATATIMIILILLVKEKTKDIGILKSMGVPSGDILQIFLYNGFLISFLGCVIGIGLGVLIVENVNTVEDLLFEYFGLRVFPKDIYYLDKIPTELSIVNVLLIIVPTLVLSVIFCIIPAYLAAKMEPVRALGSEFYSGKGSKHVIATKAHANKDIAKMKNDFFAAEKLSKEYLMGSQNLRILDNLKISIAKEKVSAIIGPSGSGKSTILHLLGLLDSATSGSIYLDGLSVDSLSDRQKSQILNKKIGFIFQFYHLFPEFTALENVVMATMVEHSLFSWSQVKEKKMQRAKDLLSQFGLQDRLTHLPHQLSGGERQRVAIARALINEPQIVLCDEPTGNLDEKNSQSIQDLIWELNKEYKQTFVIVTHDLKIAKKADEVYRLEHGQLIKDQISG